jgi:hypothetical protein
MPAGHSNAQIIGWISMPLDVLLASILVMLLVTPRRAGDLLLDLGPLRRDRRVIAVAGLWLLNGTNQAWAGHRYLGLGFVLLGASQLILATQHLQICEKGILTIGFFGRRLLRWEDILSCTMQPRGTLLVELRGKGWIARGLKIPVELRDQLDAALAPRCPRLRPPVAA